MVLGHTGFVRLAQYPVPSSNPSFVRSFVRSFVAWSILQDSTYLNQHTMNLFFPFFGLTVYPTITSDREILGSDKKPFDWDVCGMNLCLIYSLSVPYMIWLLLLEYAHDGGAGGMLGRALRRLRDSFESMSLRWSGVRRSPDGMSLHLADGLDSSRGGDEDVAAEQDRVVSNRDDLEKDASVLLVNMWKVYPPSVGMFGSVTSKIKGWVRYLCCCCCYRRPPINGAGPDSGADDEHKSFLPKRAVRGLTTAIGNGETYGLLGVSTIYLGWKMKSRFRRFGLRFIFSFRHRCKISNRPTLRMFLLKHLFR